MFYLRLVVECTQNSDCTGANAFCNTNALVCACPNNYYLSNVNGLVECERKLKSFFTYLLFT